MRKMMMIALSVLFSAGMVSAQQSIRSEHVADFKSMSFTGKLTVELIPAQENAVNIELHNADINKIDWGVVNGVLSVKLKPSGLGSSPGSATVKVSYKEVNNISVNGAEVLALQPIREDMLAIDLSSGAKMTAAVDCEDLEVKVSGNSAAVLEGTSKYLTLHVNMRSKADARKLNVVSAAVLANSGAEVYVSATERLAVESGTASTVFYQGDPRIQKLSTKLGGEIHNIAAKAASAK